MANLKNINFMSKAKFDSVTTSDDELYFVDFGDIDFVVESYVNGTNWYRVYKSGWVEQGGYTSGVENNNDLNVVFLKPMENNKYTATIGWDLNDDGIYHSRHAVIRYGTRTTTGFSIRNARDIGSSADGMAISWQVSGQGA